MVLFTRLHAGWITGPLWNTLDAIVCHNTQTALVGDSCRAWRQDPLESVQCGVIKECRDCGFGSCALINVVKQRKVFMF